MICNKLYCFVIFDMPLSERNLSDILFYICLLVSVYICLLVSAYICLLVSTYEACFDLIAFVVVESNINLNIFKLCSLIVTSCWATYRVWICSFVLTEVIFMTDAALYWSNFLIRVTWVHKSGCLTSQSIKNKIHKGSQLYRFII